MSDSEKVIKALTICSKTEWCENNTDCPYFDSEKEVHFEDCKQMLKDALELLKEQKPVIVRQREMMHMLFWCCGSCGAPITEGDKFCRMCGKAVKWDE